ncbi:sensor histidine kinase [Sporolactobacillus vineae]|uniref:sensor histidine kinase n=1 Tax=Sporolactobacillus vineae TaxID=444463 RepID=UPI000288455D|nr:HAMP domain-containing sensor histidine kinase [Sporolactobacillus vineae]
MTINRIGLKLGSVILGLMAVVLICSGLAVDRLFTNFYEMQMKEQTRELAAHFVEMASPGGASSQEMIRTFARFSGVSVYRLEGNGKVQALTKDGQTAGFSMIPSSETQKLLSGRQVEFPVRDAQGRRYFAVGRTIKTNASGNAAIYILSSMASADQSLWRLRRLLILSGAGAYLLAAGLILILSNLLSRRLLRMQQMTEKMARGNWAVRLHEGSHDEVGKLGHSINDLAASLQRYRDTRQAFFSNVSHELRTPVTYLQGYARVLADGRVTSEQEKAQYLSIIYEESVRLGHLINDLFDLAKLEEGRIPIKRDALDLKSVILEAAGKVRLKAETKHLNLRTDLPDTVPPLRGDRQRMVQVLLNLLENAIRYTEKGRITVRVRRQEGTTAISVSDTGIGIPEQELPYIFERFYRVEKSRARQYGGTGLGLSIVKAFTERQGGSVHVTSQVGRGTTFTLLFPDVGPRERDDET